MKTMAFKYFKKNDEQGLTNNPKMSHFIDNQIKHYVVTHEREKYFPKPYIRERTDHA